MNRAARALALLAALGAVACATPAQGAEPGPTQAAPVMVAVRMSEFHYSEPLIEVPAGRTIMLMATNGGIVDHDLNIDALGVHLLLRPGKSGNVTIGPMAPGAHLLYCSIPTHREAGMVATLLVK